MDDETKKAKKAAYMRDWSARNKDRVHRHTPAYRREWYAKNKEKAKEYQKAHRERRKQAGLCEYQRNPETSKRYFQENKIALMTKNQVRQNTRYSEDPTYRLMLVLRARINSAVRNDHKKCSAVRDLGCSIEEFKKYIEAQFQEGMCWENWGRNDINKLTWQLDHIIPISRFDLADEDQQKSAFNYSNYQPLWASENAQKHTKTHQEYEVWLERDKNRQKTEK